MTLTMSFLYSKASITVHGDPNLSKSVISSKALLKLDDVEFASMLWDPSVFQFSVLEGSSVEAISTEQQKQLQGVLE